MQWQEVFNSMTVVGQSDPTNTTAPVAAPVNPNLLTREELDHLQLITKFTAMASILGSLVIIITWSAVKHFRNPTTRLIFFQAIAELMGSIALFIGRWAADSGNGGFCLFQAVLIHQFVLASIFWSGIIAFNLLIVVFVGKKERHISHYEKYYHIVAWGIPCAGWIISLAIGANSEFPVFGDTTLWCWITAKWNSLQIALFYVFPLWVTFIFDVIVYVLVGIKLSRTFKRTEDFKGKADKSWAVKRKRRYVLTVSLYSLAFFATWLPGSINRIHLWQAPNQIYLMFVFHAIFTPLQGFLNFLVYFWMTLVHYWRYGVSAKSSTTGSAKRSEQTASIL
eukprot:TRINITY_DN11581_c0_g1_i2.p1 TRINITY_DN11581_c0_g1~~TRINITY_DN11581_c0_g1_i2.p1  ORF type:complete len:337 (+),score=29.94 TRINITY_DN11581_c0_g1_i2:423-1433(+)